MTDPRDPHHGPPPSDLPADAERSHQPTTASWSECHRLLALADDRAAALAMRVGIHIRPIGDTASFHCVVFRVGLRPVVIVEADIAVPAGHWELRTSGLWADSNCETPLVHWSYGLEAFALAIDEPTEMLSRGYGDRVPLGWELDFESSPDRVAVVGPRAYSQRGRLDGLLLFADGAAPIAGTAVRQHWWGATDRLDDTGDPAAELDRLATIGDVGLPLNEVALPLTDADRRWLISWNGPGLGSRTAVF